MQVSFRFNGVSILGLTAALERETYRALRWVSLLYGTLFS